MGMQGAMISGPFSTCGIILSCCFGNYLKWVSGRYPQYVSLYVKVLYPLKTKLIVYQTILTHFGRLVF